MRIGELAKRSGVTVRTVRYYIEQGLLPSPRKRGKYGDFDDSYLQRLRLIQHLKKERLALPAIRDRLMEMGLAGTPLPTQPFFSPAASPEGEGVFSPQAAHERGEGLFRSRFAEEAGLNPMQVAQLEEMGLLESGEGLLPPEDIPLARAAARLLAGGATTEDLGELTHQIHQEAAMHRRLLSRAGPLDPLSEALRRQEQVGAVATIRQMLLRRWSHMGQEKPQ